MAIINSFRALRPISTKAEQVSCVPYDVPYDAEVRDIFQHSPLSFLRVTRPEADFGEGENPSAELVLERARRNLQKLIDDETLVVELEPCFYVYRLASDSHTQTGVVACASIDEYDGDLVKKHEKTRPDKVEERTAHMLALKAQTGLIFLAYRGTEKINQLIAQTTSGKPLYDFECSGHVRQTVWRVEQTDDLAAAFADVPALYIADGHHRAESASVARKTLRDGNPDHTGDEEYNFVLAGIFPAEDLRILAYNRVVKDLNGLTDDEFFAKLQASFIVSETGGKQPENRGEFRMYFGGKWYELNFAVSFFREPDAIERLDVSILQQYVLAPILGIGDPRTDERVSFVGGARGTEELEKLVDSGEARVAFSLYPTTIEDLFAVSDMGEIMPPKSTWFEPKLKDGLFVHLI